VPADHGARLGEVVRGLEDLAGLAQLAHLARWLHF
jgi:hypothetical protein